MKCITMMLAAALLANVAWADTTITYQGQLSHGGQPFSGTANLAFQLFGDDTGGVAVGPAVELANHPVVNGLFQAELDFGSAFDGSARFLEVSVNGDVLVPRQAVRAAPVAIYALSGGGDSVWTLSGNDALFSGGNVGVGTSAPSARLQVVGRAVVGHASNEASGDFSMVAGGQAGEATAAYSFVGGGFEGSASGIGSFVAAGSQNEAAGLGSFAAGNRAKALHPLSFVWADGTQADFASTQPNQFMVRSSGGVGFGRPPSDYFVISGPQEAQDSDYSYGTGAMRVLVDGVTKFRILGNGGVGIGAGFSNTGVPVDGLRVAGPTHLNGLLRVIVDDAAKLRVLGTGVAIGTGFTSVGVPVDGLRVAGATRLDDQLQVDGTAVFNGQLVAANTAFFNAATIGANFVTPVILQALESGGGTDLCRNAQNFISACSSSARYKDDIADLGQALTLIDALRPVSYRWIDSGEADIGLVAEEVAFLEPRLATYREDGEVEGVKYRQLTAVLVRALQEQRQENSAALLARDREIATLRAELAEQRRETAQRLAVLEQMLVGDTRVAGNKP